MSDVYTFQNEEFGIRFEVDRLRRERHELVGELRVHCTLPGALVTEKGVLSIADFNLSSARARQDRARLLKDRARTNGTPDWFGLLEDFCQRVFEAERAGDPAVKLRDLPKPERGDDILVDGLAFPRRHAAILFGDGGAAKSYTALYVAGRLVERGMRVALFDWELCGEDHRDRLERLFPAMPDALYYCRCERPLTVEADRLQRVVREHSIDYSIYDSIAFACHGRPEDAEIAGAYFRAVRQIGGGSLHIAHVNKSEENDKKPFGSSFWHNGARSTWNVQAIDDKGDTLRLGLFNRKSNLGPLRPPVGYALTFTDIATTFRRVDVADSPDLATRLSVRQRMAHLLKRGSLPAEEVAEAIEADVETVKREARRRKNEFVILDGGRIGLAI